MFCDVAQSLCTQRKCTPHPGSVTAGVKEHMASGDPKLGVADSWRRGDIPTKSKEDDTKPTLYHTDTSYYSQVDNVAILPISR